MTTQAEAVLLRIREMIMRGQFAPGARLMEIALADEIGVSRTPVRWALGTLAQEGLVLYTPQRGFVVRGYSIKEIVDAVAVRGRLEGLACRIVAEQGLSREDSDRLADNLARTAALRDISPFEPSHVQVWCDLNSEFHNTISTASANESLLKFLGQIDTIPLAAPRTIAATASNVERVIRVVDRAVLMHGLVFDALQKRQPDRADLLMQEHVHQGHEALGAYLHQLAESRSDEEAGPIRLVDSKPQDGRNQQRRRRTKKQSEPAV